MKYLPILSAKFDCPVARQLLLPTLHDCDTTLFVLHFKRVICLPLHEINESHAEETRVSPFMTSTPPFPLPQSAYVLSDICNPPQAVNSYQDCFLSPYICLLFV